MGGCFSLIRMPASAGVVVDGVPHERDGGEVALRRWRRGGLFRRGCRSWCICFSYEIFVPIFAPVRNNPSAVGGRTGRGRRCGPCGRGTPRRGGGGGEVALRRWRRGGLFRRGCRSWCICFSYEIFVPIFAPVRNNPSAVRGRTGRGRRCGRCGRGTPRRGGVLVESLVCGLHGGRVTGSGGLGEGARVRVVGGAGSGRTGVGSEMGLGLARESRVNNYRMQAQAHRCAVLVRLAGVHTRAADRSNSPIEWASLIGLHC